MLTKEESAWVRKVQKLLDACPSERLGFYTSGDRSVGIYDLAMKEEIEGLVDWDQSTPFGQAVNNFEADLGRLDFPQDVHAVAG